MHEVPHPSHGFFGVTVAFLGYVGFVVAVAVGLSALRLPDPVVLAASGITAVGLLIVLLPLFRRLTPDGPGGE